MTKVGDRFVEFVMTLLATFAGVYLAFGLERNIEWYYLVALLGTIIVFVLVMLVLVDKKH